VIEEVATARGFATNKTFVGHGVNQCVFPQQSAFVCMRHAESLPYAQALPCACTECPCTFRTCLILLLLVPLIWFPAQHYAGSRASGTMRVGQVRCALLLRAECEVDSLARSQTFTIEPMICVGTARDTHWPDNVSPLFARLPLALSD
jgi:methionine aminopeptidase